MNKNSPNNLPWIKIVFKALIFGLPIWFLLSMFASVGVYAFKGAHDLTLPIILLGGFGFIIYLIYTTNKN